MYSIKGTKDIEFNYNISSIRKISNTEYQYHGKPNNPNLVLSNGIKRISYVAERIEIKRGNPSELIIHHSATSNFPKKASVIFPLVVSNGHVNEIDRLLGMEVNETLDLDIGSEITDFTMEINESQKTAYIIRLSSGLHISKSIQNDPIIEGLSCGLNKLEQTNLKTALDHAKSTGNPHKHDIDQKSFNTMLKGFLDKESMCYIGDSKNGVKSTVAECNARGGDMRTSSVTNISNVGDDLSPNREMECFPNEGGVFNFKFHIIYDISADEQFIANDGAKILGEDPVGNNDETLRNAINASVKNLKEHIEKLGGIYVKTAKVPKKFNSLKTNNQKYSQAIDTDVGSMNEFFAENADDDIKIFITYVVNGDDKIRKFDGITTDNKLDGKSALTKPHQVNECILVAVKNNSSVRMMNATKFSEEFLNKDFNRYTHISIPGYMTDTENKSMKVIMNLLAIMISFSISYYTVPGFYKIAVQKITYNSRDCGSEPDKYKNYYMVKAFNYLFVILTIIVPLILMWTTGVNGILSIIMFIGIVFTSTILARSTFDHMFFYTFYPKDGLTPCNKTKHFKENQAYGSGFKTFLYIPQAISALISR
jgi:hypothetical protein